jgi:hypothetical protein
MKLNEKNEKKVLNAVLWIRLFFDAGPDGSTSNYHPDADSDADPDSDMNLMRIRIQILTSK